MGRRHTVAGRQSQSGQPHITDALEKAAGQIQVGDRSKRM